MSNPFHGQFFIRGFAILCLTLTVATVFSQTNDETRNSLFSVVDKMMTQVQAEQGNLIAPTAYRSAVNKYNQAVAQFQNGKRVEAILVKVNEIKTLLNKCLKIAMESQIIFATVLKAREDALTANAPQHTPELFEEAEADFNSAAKKFEKNNNQNAKRRIPGIEKKYRQAELNSIKISTIGTVRNLMQEARAIEADEYTPITYANALRLLNEAEAILNASRRSESNAKEKAEQAELEAKHAIFLTKLTKRLRKNEKEWENFFLDREVIIEGIARGLGFKPQFDEGMDKPLEGILKISRLVQTERKSLLLEVQEKNEEIRQLTETIKKYREQEQGLQAELQDKQYRLELKRRREETIHSIEQMFSSRDGVVLRKGDDLIIRLIGLTFPSGKSVIAPEFFSLLATLQRALRKFSSSHITIEGHTDAIGDDRYNENLSYERASAIKQYLLANMGLDDSRITAVGYGETKPIASNNSALGRAQNRRIDIAVTFNQETL